MVAAARAGERAAFAELVERHRRELQVHCSRMLGSRMLGSRMLGSFEDAEDLVQETFLRAWCERFQGRSSFRAWLYRIATNACLNALAPRSRRVLPPQVMSAPRIPSSAPCPHPTQGAPVHSW